MNNDNNKILKQAKKEEKMRKRFYAIFIFTFILSILIAFGMFFYLNDLPVEEFLTVGLPALLVFALIGILYTSAKNAIVKKIKNGVVGDGSEEYTLPESDEDVGSTDSEESSEDEITRSYLDELYDDY